MADTAILFVKPRAISAKDKKALQGSGVFVVEIDNPDNAKFVRANAELSTTEMLTVAMTAMKNSSSALDAFGRAINAALLAKDKPPTTS